MERIASFEVDHRYIVPGIYLSRIDGDITTYDLRTRKPNCGDFMSDSIMHTFEHLFATYVRNSEIGSKVIYFGPMGCATGFYLLIRNADHGETLKTVISVLEQIINHKGEVFGNSEIECGNYKSLNLSAAVEEAKKYLAVLKQNQNTNFKYPVK
ncbi:MAG: S-ribosylhomocysteine lyase [Acutalibacteraceae bacterium]|nr:S-ribosylhomocysteine lyase [Acutalibacteraceae bacterium]